MAEERHVTALDAFEDLARETYAPAVLSVDEKTLCNTPLPIAASTLLQTQTSKKSYKEYILGSFLDGYLTNDESFPDSKMQKFSLKNLDSVNKSKNSFSDLEVTIDRSKLSNQFDETRSSFGILPVETMDDLSDSILHLGENISRLPKPRSEHKVCGKTSFDLRLPTVPESVTKAKHSFSIFNEYDNIEENSDEGIIHNMITNFSDSDESQNDGMFETYAVCFENHRDTGIESGKRSAASGLDSANLSEIDTEDELEAVRQENKIQEFIPHRKLNQSLTLSVRPCIEGVNSQDSENAMAKTEEEQTRPFAESKVEDSNVSQNGGSQINRDVNEDKFETAMNFDPINDMFIRLSMLGETLLKDSWDQTQESFLTDCEGRASPMPSIYLKPTTISTSEFSSDRHAKIFSDSTFDLEEIYEEIKESKSESWENELDEKKRKLFENASNLSYQNVKMMLNDYPIKDTSEKEGNFPKQMELNQADFKLDLDKSCLFVDNSDEVVPDLAFYTPFSQDLFDSNEAVQENDFFTRENCPEMLEKDEEEFQKNSFIQEDAMIGSESSPTLTNSSWILPSESNLYSYRPSWLNLSEEDQSYMRISIGAIIGSRTETLGSLDHGNNVNRPTFGCNVVSPKKVSAPSIIDSSEHLMETFEKDSSIRSSGVGLEKSVFQDDVTNFLPSKNNFLSSNQAKSETQNRKCIELKTSNCDFEANSSAVSNPLDLSSAGIWDKSAYNSTIHISAISKLIEEVSLNTDPCILAQLAIKLSKEKSLRSNSAQSTNLNNDYKSASLQSSNNDQNETVIFKDFSENLPIISCRFEEEEKILHSITDSMPVNERNIKKPQISGESINKVWATPRPSSIYRRNDCHNLDELETRDLNIVEGIEKVNIATELNFSKGTNMITPSSETEIVCINQSVDSYSFISTGNLNPNEHHQEINDPVTLLASGSNNFQEHSQSCNVLNKVDANQYFNKSNLIMHDVIGGPQYWHPYKLPTISTIIESPIQQNIASIINYNEELTPFISPHSNHFKPNKFSSQNAVSNILTWSADRQATGLLNDQMLNLDSVLSSRIITAPKELNFYEVCCVGFSTCAGLLVQNLSSQKVPCFLEFIPMSTWNKNINLHSNTAFLVKPHVFLKANTSEEIKIQFLPPEAGLYSIQLRIACDGIAEVSPIFVTISAVAEEPSIQIMSNKSKCLNFGPVSRGCKVKYPLTLVNHGKSTVPLRLVISAVCAGNNYFHFLNTNNLSNSSSLPSVITTCVLKGDLYQVNIPIIFIAPEIFTSESEIFQAHLTVYLNTSRITTVVNSLLLQAQVGVTKLHTNLEMLVLTTTWSMGTLPLRNAGNIPLFLELTIVGHEDVFHVTPCKLVIPSDSENKVTVKFTPKSTSISIYKSLLVLNIIPNGESYEVPLQGQVQPVYSATEPSLLSNKQSLAWGGVPVGKSVIQRFILRNTSTSEVGTIKVIVRHNPQEFKIQKNNESGFNSNSQIFQIQPLEDCPIYVTFTPTRITSYKDKLAIKMLNNSNKFAITLTGYGGTSNVMLKCASESTNNGYWINLGNLKKNERRSAYFELKNIGVRAAFVKIIDVTDIDCPTELRSKELFISPNEFILNAQEIKMINMVAYFDVDFVDNAPSRPNTNSLLTVLAVLYGDEISRQKMRRELHSSIDGPNSDPLKKINFDITYGNFLRKNNFDTHYQGEEAVPVSDIPTFPADIQLFYSSIKNATLHVYGILIPDNDTLSQTFNALNIDDTASTTILTGWPSLPEQNHIAHRSASPPVKGTPAICKDLIGDGHLVLPSTLDTWTLFPEQLLLISDQEIDEPSVGQVIITNQCEKSLSFKLSCPNNNLTISPVEGSIAPKSSCTLLIYPDLSKINTKGDQWSSFVANCDGRQKEVKIQIIHQNKDLKVVQPIPPSELRAANNTQDSEKHLLRLFPSEINFLSIKVMETSDTSLKLVNTSSQRLKWILSSVAPTYLKGSNNKTIFRAKYSVFRFSKVSGILDSDKEIQICVQFLPREVGVFSQCWQVQAEKDNYVIYTQRIQVIGQGVFNGEQHSFSPSNSASVVKTTSSVNVSRFSLMEERKSENIVLDQMPVFSTSNDVVFPETDSGKVATIKMQFKNASTAAHVLEIVKPKAPFSINYHNVTIKAKHYMNLPIHFKPHQVGTFQDVAIINVDVGYSITISLTGSSVH